MYTIEKWVGDKDGLLYTFHPRYGGQVWSESSLTKIKIGTPCAMCGEPLEERGYRPVTNAKNRADRICHRHKPGKP
jgi:hypothetical protein